jgi:glycosyltransferase involved in cell wall biosynthesis
LTRNAGGRAERACGTIAAEANRPDICIFSPLARGGTKAHGGITPVVCNLAVAFADAGRKVELLTFSPTDPRSLFPKLDERIMIRNLGRGGRLRHLFQLRDYLRERRPRVLLSAGQRPNLLAATCKRLCRPPSRVILSVHNNLTRGFDELGGLKRRMRVSGMRAFYPAADAVVCVSVGVKGDLARYVALPSEKLRVIYNPVFSPRQLGEVVATPLHPWLERGQPLLILGIGRLTKQKDFPTLIRAFASVAARRACRLMILGEGRERQDLQRLTSELGLDDRVALPGFVDNAMGYMGEAGLFVLSSAWEGFGMVLVEAMACGTPVVSTDCPSGPREILLDGSLGPLVRVGDSEALARAMLLALDAPVDPDRLRRRAADFTSDLAAANYLRLMFPGEASDHASG